MKTASIMKSLALPFEAVQQLLSEFDLAIASPDDDVPDEVGKKLLKAAGKLQERIPQLNASSETPPQSDRPLLSNDSELSLKDVKTIAQSSKVSHKTVRALEEALRVRKQQIALQEGFYEKQREIATREFGGTLAMMLYNQDLSKELDAAEEVLDKSVHSLHAIAASMKIDLDELVDGQNDIEKERAERNQRAVSAAEQILKGEEPLDGIIPSSRVLMEKQLESLGKAFGIGKMP